MRGKLCDLGPSLHLWILEYDGVVMETMQPVGVAHPGVSFQHICVD